MELQRQLQEVIACGPGASCWGVSVRILPKSSVCVFSDKLQARLAGEREGLGVWACLTGGLVSGECLCNEDVNSMFH